MKLPASLLGYEMSVVVGGGGWVLVLLMVFLEGCW